MLGPVERKWIEQATLYERAVQDLLAAGVTDEKRIQKLEELVRLYRDALGMADAARDLRDRREDERAS